MWCHEIDGQENNTNVLKPFQAVDLVSIMDQSGLKSIFDSFELGRTTLQMTADACVVCGDRASGRPL